MKTSGVMNDLDFREDGSPTFQKYDIVNLGRTGFVKASDYNHRVESGAIAIEKATGIFHLVTWRLYTHIFFQLLIIRVLK